MQIINKRKNIPTKAWNWTTAWLRRVYISFCDFSKVKKSRVSHITVYCISEVGFFVIASIRKLASVTRIHHHYLRTKEREKWKTFCDAFFRAPASPAWKSPLVSVTIRERNAASQATALCRSSRVIKVKLSSASCARSIRNGDNSDTWSGVVFEKQFRVWRKQKAGHFSAVRQQEKINSALVIEKRENTHASRSRWEPASRVILRKTNSMNGTITRVSCPLRGLYCLWARRIRIGFHIIKGRTRVRVNEKYSTLMMRAAWNRQFKWAWELC